MDLELTASQKRTAKKRGKKKEKTADARYASGHRERALSPTMTQVSWPTPSCRETRNERKLGNKMTRLNWKKRRMQRRLILRKTSLRALSFDLRTLRR